MARTFYFSFRLFLVSFFGSILVSACASSPSESDSDSYLNPTVYYKPVIRQQDQKCSAQQKVDLVGRRGERLAEVCPETHKICLMQGSCVVQKGGDWISYNYHSRGPGGEARFTVLDRQVCPYGFGVKSLCLDPYFSVAADLEYFKAGQVLFVPDLVGLELPTGETHDGFVIVRDRGGSIKGPHRVDFFIGYSEPLRKTEVFMKKGLGDKKKRVPFRRATDAESAAVLKSRAYPGLKEDLRKKIPL